MRAASGPAQAIAELDEADVAPRSMAGRADVRRPRPARRNAAVSAPERRPVRAARGIADAERRARRRDARAEVGSGGEGTPGGELLGRDHLGEVVGAGWPARGSPGSAATASSAVLGRQPRRDARHRSRRPARSARPPRTASRRPAGRRRRRVMQKRSHWSRLAAPTLIQRPSPRLVQAHRVERLTEAASPAALHATGVGVHRQRPLVARGDATPWRRRRRAGPRPCARRASPRPPPRSPPWRRLVRGPGPAALQRLPVGLAGEVGGTRRTPSRSAGCCATPRTAPSGRSR